MCVCVCVCVCTYVCVLMHLCIYIHTHSYALQNIHSYVRTYYIKVMLKMTLIHKSPLLSLSVLILPPSISSQQDGGSGWFGSVQIPFSAALGCPREPPHVNHWRQSTKHRETLLGERQEAIYTHVTHVYSLYVHAKKLCILPIVTVCMYVCTYVCMCTVYTDIRRYCVFSYVVTIRMYICVYMCMYVHTYIGIVYSHICMHTRM